MQTSPRLIALLVGACFSFTAHGATFDEWADKVANAKVARDPEQATQKQYFSGAEQDRLDRALTPNTAAFRASEVASAKAALTELAAIDQKPLTPQQRASASAIAWNLQGVVDSAQFEDYTFVFNQFTGVHVQLVNFLTQAHPIRNQRDVENYLERLKAVAGKIDTGVARAKDAAGRASCSATSTTAWMPSPPPSSWVPAAPACPWKSRPECLRRAAIGGRDQNFLRR